MAPDTPGVGLQGPGVLGAAAAALLYLLERSGWGRGMLSAGASSAVPSCDMQPAGEGSLRGREAAAGPRVSP